MSREEIEEYLKRVDELGAKLTGKDKETYAWLVYGYNQCAKWLNETEEQCKKQKEVIDKINHILNNQINYREFVDIVNAIEDVVKEVSE